MTALQLIDNQLNHLDVHDTIEHAIRQMEIQKCNHLPVLETGVFRGLISDKNLELHENKKDELQSLEREFIVASVSASVHFLRAVTIANLYRTNVIPVTGEQSEYLGSITQIDLINAIGNFCGAGEYGALIVLEIEKARLVLSELNAIMESDGATILHYNASPIAATQVLEVTIGLDKKEVATIIASLERYHYKVLYYSGEDMLETELEDNYNNLMNYLDI